MAAWILNYYQEPCDWKQKDAKDVGVQQLTNGARQQKPIMGAQSQLAAERSGQPRVTYGRRRVFHDVSARKKTEKVPARSIKISFRSYNSITINQSINITVLTPHLDGNRGHKGEPAQNFFGAARYI